MRTLSSCSRPSPASVSTSKRVSTYDLLHPINLQVSRRKVLGAVFDVLRDLVSVSLGLEPQGYLT